jgi:hypothetical protein
VRVTLKSAASTACASAASPSSGSSLEALDSSPGGDGASGDLGYPSTVELGDGSLLTVWYEALRGSPHAVLRQARWRLRS